MKLESLPNISKALAQRLSECNINTAEDLRKMGSKKAFEIYCTMHTDGCINFLYALEGAVQGIRWHGLSTEIKAELKEFYDSRK